MNSPELSCILKIEHARKYIENFNIAIERWFKDHLHPTRIDPDPSDPTHLFIKSGIDPIPINPFSLMLGDGIQNLRSSLDHLAFELARIYTNPLSEEFARKVQFPVIGDETSRGVQGSGPAMFRDNAVQMLQAIHPKAKAVIEGLQPYQRGRDYRSHPLWILNELSNIDKHRMLHITAWNFAGLVFPSEVLIPQHKRLEGGKLEVFGLGAVEGETVFARVPRGLIVPEKHMQIKIHPAFKIAFKDGPFVGEMVMDTIEMVFNYIITDVFPKLEPFL